MKKNLESASANAILVSPRFMSTVRNKGAYKDSELAWGDVNAWAAGEASTHPPGVAISTFTVLDSLLNE